MIESYQFGKIKINGKIFDHDIFINIVGDIQSWQREESHRIDKEDIKEAIELGPEILILGTGAYGVAKVTNQVKEFCRQQRINLIIKPSSEAVKKYNQLKQDNKKVAAYFHLTC